MLLLWPPYILCGRLNSSCQFSSPVLELYITIFCFLPLHYLPNIL